MKYIVYKITNLINGKIYIGVHKTKNIEDGYMGSGKLIKRAIAKYGISNFKKENLAIFDNQIEMFKMESELVSDLFLEKSDVYNLKNGGSGGWDFVNNNLTKEQRSVYNSKSGSWNNKEKRRKVWETVPLKFRIDNARKMGKKFGGMFKLSKEEIDLRLKIMSEIDLNKFGWVGKVSEKLKISHTQVRRFVEKYYTGSYYRRK